MIEHDLVVPVIFVPMLMFVLILLTGNLTEDVGWPACSEDSEWGGVDPEWWEGAVDKYGWDVDVDSIEILLDDPYVWYDNRYNVVMRRLDGPECRAQD